MRDASSFISSKDGRGMKREKKEREGTRKCVRESVGVSPPVAFVGCVYLLTSNSVSSRSIADTEA